MSDPKDWKPLLPAGTISEVLDIMECLRLRIEAVEWSNKAPIEEETEGVAFVGWEYCYTWMLKQMKSLLKERGEESPITEDVLNDLIQPHAITLEHGEKAAKDIWELLNQKI